MCVSVRPRERIAGSPKQHSGQTKGMRKQINFSQVRSSFPHKISKENMKTTTVTPNVRKREIKRSVKIVSGEVLREN